MSQGWRTRRKPEHDWGSGGRKWNTPLDLNRKQPGKEDSDRMYTHTFRELDFCGLEHRVTYSKPIAQPGTDVPLCELSSLSFISCSTTREKYSQSLDNSVLSTLKHSSLIPKMNYLEGVQIWTHATLMRDGASETGNTISIWFEERMFSKRIKTKFCYLNLYSLFLC